MVRRSSDIWVCVVCGEEALYGLVCLDCDRKEKDRQRSEPGSLTEKQLSYIEHLISGLSSQATSKIIYDAVPDYGGELESLSAHQAGKLISELLASERD